MVKIIIFFLFLNISVFTQTGEPKFNQKDFLYIKPMGKTTSNIDDLFSKKEITLKFLATWCPKCRKEVKEEQLKKEEFIYIFGNYGNETEESILNFLSENPQVYPAYFNSDNYLYKKYNVTKVPTAIILKNY